MIVVANIEIEEATDFVFSVVHKDEKTNLPIDLTGWDAEMEIRPSFGSQYTLLEFTSGSGGRIVLGTTTGKIDVTFVPADTIQLPGIGGWSRAAYDLVLTNLSGKKTKIYKGFITISRTASL